MWEGLEEERGRKKLCNYNFKIKRNIKIVIIVGELRGNFSVNLRSRLYRLR